MKEGSHMNTIGSGLASTGLGTGDMEDKLNPAYGINSAYEDAQEGPENVGTDPTPDTNYAQRAALASSMG